MDNRIVITVAHGKIESIEGIPGGLVVEVRDYGCTGIVWDSWDSGFTVETDEFGEEYQMRQWN